MAAPVAGRCAKKDPAGLFRTSEKKRVWHELLASWRARVLVLAAAEPASGSEMDTEKRILPSMKGLMYFAFCAGVPYLEMFIAVKVGTSTEQAKSKPYLPRPSAISE